MDEVSSIYGIDPNDLINNRGLLRSIFNVYDHAILVVELAFSSSGALITLPVMFANSAAQRLFQTSLSSQADLLSLDISFHSGQSWENCINRSLGDETCEEEVLYNINGVRKSGQIVVLKVSNTKLIILLKDIKPSDIDSKIAMLRTLDNKTECMLNFGSWEYDVDAELMYWSKGMYQIFNLPDNSPVSADKYLDFAIPGDKLLIEEFIMRLKSSEYSFEQDLALNVQGKVKLIHVESSPIKNASGKICKVIGLNADITETVEFKKELSTQQHFIEQILQASPVLIDIYDLNREVFIYFSKEVSPFVGYTSDTMLSMRPEELQGLIDEDDKQRVLEFFNGFGGARDDDIRTIEYRIKAIDNTYRWLKVRAKVFMRDESGKVSQVICAVQDYTLTKDAEDRLRENEMMQLLLQRKDEFINIASHELKTPITTVKASLQILQRMMERQEREPVINVFLQKALSQTNKLVVLTRDLIDNAKLQSGKMRLNLEVFDLDTFLSEAIEEQMEGFEIIVENWVKRPVRADRRRLEQVLKNFLSNAAKYSPSADKIIVKAEEEINSFRISVKDFGIGIPDDKVSNVFDRFYRVDDKALQFPGLGLGLHICAEIIKMHGGDYGVDSVFGEGSTFWFSIPDTTPH